MSTQNISVSEILNSAKSLEDKNFETLYKEMVSLHTTRHGRDTMDRLSTLESELLNKINMEFDEKKWERLKYLDWKLEFGALNVKEESESLRLAEAFENYSVERLKSLSQLAALRQVSVDTLIKQMDINLKVHD